MKYNHYKLGKFYLNTYTGLTFNKIEFRAYRYKNPKSIIFQLRLNTTMFDLGFINKSK